MTFEYLRCDSCGGRKTVVGIGMLNKKCAVCSGIGYVKKEIINENTENYAEQDQVEDTQNPSAKIKMDKGKTARRKA